MIWNREKGCIIIGNKKYFKGNELPKDFKPSKDMLDKEHVIDKSKEPEAPKSKEPELKETKKKKVDGGKS